MNDNQKIKELHSRLQDKGRWYIDPSPQDDTDIIDIQEKARETADDAIADMTQKALYERYRKWQKEEHIAPEIPGDMSAFLNQLVYDLGYSGLDKDEKAIFEFTCFLTLNFI